MNLVKRYCFVSFDKVFTLDAVVMFGGSPFQIRLPIN